jgi:hypothetical protein
MMVQKLAVLREANTDCLLVIYRANMDAGPRLMNTKKDSPAFFSAVPNLTLVPGAQCCFQEHSELSRVLRARKQIKSTCAFQRKYQDWRGKGREEKYLAGVSLLKTSCLPDRAALPAVAMPLRPTQFQSHEHLRSSQRGTILLGYRNAAETRIRHADSREPRLPREHLVYSLLLPN